MTSDCSRYVCHSPAEITAKSAAFCPALGVDEVGRKRMRACRGESGGKGRAGTTGMQSHTRARPVAAKCSKHNTAQIMDWMWASGVSGVTSRV